MKKIKSMMLFVLFCIIILIPSRVHAGYQSKPGTALTNTTADTFLLVVEIWKQQVAFWGLKKA